MEALSQDAAQVAERLLAMHNDLGSVPTATQTVHVTCDPSPSEEEKEDVQNHLQLHIVGGRKRREMMGEEREGVREEGEVEGGKRWREERGEEEGMRKERRWERGVLDILTKVSSKG